MTRAFEGLRSVTRVEQPNQPNVFLFEVDRGERGPLFVAWERRDAFSGEDEPPIPFGMPWPSAGVTAVDAFGRSIQPCVAENRVSLELSSPGQKLSP